MALPRNSCACFFSATSQPKDFEHSDVIGAPALLASVKCTFPAADLGRSHVSYSGRWRSGRHTPGRTDTRVRPLPVLALPSLSSLSAAPAQRSLPLPGLAVSGQGLTSLLAHPAPPPLPCVPAPGASCLYHLHGRIPRCLLSFVE